ncbi:hypothetical protein GJ744_004685 [Endocarpon pusillum]|uniref:Uncharacterized protein n=1 Tax=Endocarpon pusillum TaxID=364733 RepID=A0A8H7A9D6_9EURO|nr:hypothetical protein GJ744_004685 [Endocarpon pusillum]
MLEVYADRISAEIGQSTPSENDGNDNRSNIGGEGDRHSGGTLASHGTNHDSYFYNTRHQRVVISSSASRTEGDQQEIIWDDIISSEV